MVPGKANKGADRKNNWEFCGFDVVSPPFPSSVGFAFSKQNQGCPV
jgi:hypothetical protein